MKQIFLTAAILAGFSAGAEGGRRIYAPRTACSSIQNYIHQNGWAIVYKSDDIYERIVRDSGFCVTGDYAKSPATVKAKDNDQCYIGWKCGPR